MDQAIAEVKNVMKSGEFELIFLATDDIAAVECFRREFGSQVVFYQDVYRGESNTSIAFSNSEREYHHYCLGYEVLRDVYTLATCKGLVAGLSQVMNCAKIVKASKREYFEPMVIINNGINYEGEDWKDKKRLKKSV